MEILRFVLLLTLCCSITVGSSQNSLGDELLRQLFLRSAGNSPTCNTSPGISPGSKDAQDFVDAHNKYRADSDASDMVKLEWDNDLAKVTQELVDKCVWKHDLTKTCAGEGAGQNLYVSWTSGNQIKLDASKAVSSWYNEIKDYHYDSNKCNENKVCGHYTQVVWSGSHLVGCAAKVCDTVQGLNWGKGKYILVACNYSPPGNYRGKKPFKKGGACSACPSKFPNCDGGLCTK